MGFDDKSLHCVECDNDYTFSAAEQEEFVAKGYLNDPKRCAPCRQTRKERRGDFESFGTSKPRRQMYPIVCGQCGKAAEVPFEPRQGRPVFCSDCFSAQRTRG
jgi:CxxC-x17-CxxC domain-containing protein